MTQAQTQGFTFQIEEKNGISYVNGTPVSLDLLELNPQALHLVHENISYKVLLHKIDKDNKEITLSINGKVGVVRLQTATDLLLKSMGLDDALVQKVDAVKAAMPGLIHSILVTEGQIVQKGDPLLILEAMKMENVIKAPGGGTISKIHVSPKSSVEKGQVLLSF